MNKLFLAALTLLLALSSCQSSKVKISGRFVGSEAKMVYLEQSTVLEQQLIDSVALGEDGNFVLLLENSDQTNPTLYHLVYDNNRIPLLLKGGDNVTVSSAGNALRNYTVEGSEESELLHKFNASYVDGVLKLNDIMSRLTANDLADDVRHDLAVEYTKLKNEIKRQQLGFIVENKDHIAAIYALYQRLPGDANLFNGDSDVIYYRTVAEALAESYPDSPYLVMLRGDIARMEATQRLVENVTESSIPDLELQDIYGKKISLSSLLGKVVLLDFWSAELGNSNVMNAELKEIYAKYHNAATPFEVYQVAVDTSKPLWISTVQEQQLPWISVSDLRGLASTAVGTYNVTKLPTSFLIDKNGSIVGRDIRGEELEQKLQQLTR